MKSLEARIATLAQRLQCCPQHGTPLKCVRRFEWTGTPEQFAELMPLSDKLHPYLVHLQPTGLTCQHCGERLWCSQCYEPLTRRIVLPDDLMTPEETARYL